LSPADGLDTGVGIDVDAYLQRYAHESSTTRAERSVLRNIKYGETSVETLDFFPAGSAGPIAIFIHGGYWRRLDKDDFSFIAQGLVPLGISFASVNYGLAPITRLDTMVEQARRAVTWIRNNNDRLNVDTSRLSVFGHSAGGHLAAMSAVGVPVHAVVTISGLHDLVPVQKTFRNEWLQLTPEDAVRLSPIRYPPARRLRLHAVVGEKESDAFKAQGHALVDAWRPHGVEATYEDMPGDDHFSIMLRLANPNDPLTRTIAQIAR
jgi:arylformamidase